MFGSSGTPLPARAAIVRAAWVTLVLAGLAQFLAARAERLGTWKASIATVGDAGAIDSVELASVQDLEGELEHLLPFAGLDAGTSIHDDPDPRSPEAVRARRPADWTYPPFDETPRGSLHGPPPTATPRNLRLVARDPHGEPLTFDSLAGVQRGPDGAFQVKAYRASDDPTVWMIGSPSISPGSYAAFELEGWSNDLRWSGVASAGSIAGDGAVPLGVVAFERP